MEDISVRVHDYLEDKIQSTADLETLDSLLESVNHQHDLLQKQLVEAQQEELVSPLDGGVAGWEQLHSSIDQHVYANLHVLTYTQRITCGQIRDLRGSRVRRRHTCRDASIDSRLHGWFRRLRGYRNSSNLTTLQPSGQVFDGASHIWLVVSHDETALENNGRVNMLEAGPMRL